MKYQFIVAEVRIRLRTREEGGRRGPIRSRYRPSFHFRKSQPDGGPDPDRATWCDPFGERQSDGDIEIIGPEWLYPGEESMAIVRFSHLKALTNWLSPDCVFVFCEGPQICGEGSIIRILERPD